MRIAVAKIAQETDSFSPLTADLKDFEAHGLYCGREILERMPGVGPVGGFLEVAAEQTGVRRSHPATSRHRKRTERSVRRASRQSGEPVCSPAEVERRRARVGRIGPASAREE